MNGATIDSILSKCLGKAFKGVYSFDRWGLLPITRPAAYLSVRKFARTIIRAGREFAHCKFAHPNERYSLGFKFAHLKAVKIRDLR